jgi:sirohydrochlorin cobaltochelatase
VEIFFGMAAGAGESEAMAGALAALKKQGVDRVIAVPLLVSSHSEVYRQYQYVLGLRKDPGFSDEEVSAMSAMHHGPGGHGAHHHAALGPAVPVSGPFDAPVSLTRALDDSPEVLDALKDRVRSVSRKPAAEAVVLVAHGPNGEEDNRLWLAGLDRLSGGLQASGGFAVVRIATLRDDAPPAVKDAATAALRKDVEDLSREGMDVLVLPVLISSGGIERGIASRLAGLPCRIAQPMGDHPALSSWLHRKVQEALIP